MNKYRKYSTNLLLICSQYCMRSFNKFGEDRTAIVCSIKSKAGVYNVRYVDISMF